MGGFLASEYRNSVEAGRHKKNQQLLVFFMNGVSYFVL